MSSTQNKPTTILITRHGSSEHNLRTDVFMGRAPESRLTDTGREQARLLGGRLKKEGEPVDHIVCSSLVRTRETADLIASCLGIEGVRGEDAFWELSKGSWEGSMTKPPPPEMQAAVDAAPFTYRYENGESYQDVVARIAPVFDDLVTAHPGERILLVLHGDVIRALLYHIIRFPPHRIADFAVESCSLSEVRLVRGRYCIIRLNDTSQLGKFRSEAGNPF